MLIMYSICNKPKTLLIQFYCSLQIAYPILLTYRGNIRCSVQQIKAQYLQVDVVDYIISFNTDKLVYIYRNKWGPCKITIKVNDNLRWKWQHNRLPLWSCRYRHSKYDIVIPISDHMVWNMHFNCFCEHWTTQKLYKIRKQTFNFGWGKMVSALLCRNTLV